MYIGLKRPGMTPPRITLRVDKGTINLAKQAANEEAKLHMAELGSHRGLGEFFYLKN